MKRVSCTGILNPPICLSAIQICLRLPISDWPVCTSLKTSRAFIRLRSQPGGIERQRFYLAARSMEPEWICGRQVSHDSLMGLHISLWLTLLLSRLCCGGDATRSAPVCGNHRHRAISHHHSHSGQPTSESVARADFSAGLQQDTVGILTVYDYLIRNILDVGFPTPWAFTGTTCFPAAHMRWKSIWSRIWWSTIPKTDSRPARWVLLQV